MPRLEHISHAPLINEDGHLRVADRQFGAVHDLHVLHRESPRQHTLAAFGPLNDRDELFRNEVTQAHDSSSHDNSGTSANFGGDALHGIDAKLGIGTKSIAVDSGTT